MKKYMYVNVECYSYTEMLEIYINKYEADYQLIGYEHSCIKQQGVIVLHKREKKR